MNFLAIDTSGRQLNTVAVHGGRQIVLPRPDCAMRHSVIVMDEIDAAFKQAQLTPRDCCFFACVVGPGSFTGIRIGIATVKGLCLAAEKEALALTSFDCLAYADTNEQKLCLVDAGHGNFYACGYRGMQVSIPPLFASREQVDAIVASGYVPVAHTPLFEGVRVADAAQGLLAAAVNKAGEVMPAHALEALYLRKSSAEEGR